MGEHTLRIPMSLHARNRERLTARLQQLVTDGTVAANSVVVLQGGDDIYYNSSENTPIFRQVSAPSLCSRLDVFLCNPYQWEIIYIVWN